MRDVVDINQTLLRRTRTVYSTGAETTSQVKPVTLQVRRFRAEPVETVPNSFGEYFFPTNYQAYSCVVTPYPFTTVLRSGSTRRFVDGFGTQVGTYGWIGGASSANPSPTVSNFLKNRVRTILQNMVRSSDLNLGVSVGEAKESLSTITSLLADARALVSRLRSPVKALRGFNVKQVWAKYRSGEISKRTAQEYLRFIYGIRPIMNDIYAAIDHSFSKLREGEIAFCEVALEDAEFQSEVLQLAWGLYEGEVRRGMNSRVTFSLTDPALFELSRLGLTNPLSVVWELVTLSFVVDWFTGLGNAIESLIPPLGIKFLHGYETIWLRKDIFVLKEISSFYGGYSYLSGDRYAKSRVRALGFNRAVLTSFAVPPPFLDLGLNLDQAVSSTALIVTRLR